MSYCYHLSQLLTVHQRIRYIPYPHESFYLKLQTDSDLLNVYKRVVEESLKRNNTIWSNMDGPRDCQTE